jgi:hypothetical protein
LPTPADAFDAPDWPSTGGYETNRGERPPMPRNIEPPRHAAPEPVQAPEPKPAERTSIASLFGFGAKPEEPPAANTPSEPKPERKGWWNKRMGS